MDPRHAALLVQHAKAKLTQLIVQARVAFPPAEPRAPNKWFNLITDDIAQLKSQLDEELKRSPTASMYVDVMLSSFSPSKHTLIERWSLLHGPAAVSLGGAAPAAAAVVALDSAATTIMHDRLVLLIRNVYARLRQTPAASLVRSASLAPDAAPFAIYYILHRIGDDGSVLAGSPAMANWEGMPTTVAFSPIPTANGRLAITVTYRNDFVAPKSEAIIQQQPQIIADYIVQREPEPVVDHSHISRRASLPIASIPSVQIPTASPQTQPALQAPAASSYSRERSMSMNDTRPLSVTVGAPVKGRVTGFAPRSDSLSPPAFVTGNTPSPTTIFAQMESANQHGSALAQNNNTAVSSNQHMVTGNNASMLSAALSSALADPSSRSHIDSNLPRPSIQSTSVTSAVLPLTGTTPPLVPDLSARRSSLTTYMAGTPPSPALLPSRTPPQLSHAHSMHPNLPPLPPSLGAASYSPSSFLGGVAAPQITTYRPTSPTPATGADPALPFGSPIVPNDMSSTFSLAGTSLPKTQRRSSSFNNLKAQAALAAGQQMLGSPAPGKGEVGLISPRQLGPGGLPSQLPIQLPVQTPGQFGNTETLAVGLVNYSNLTQQRFSSIPITAPVRAADAAVPLDPSSLPEDRGGFLYSRQTATAIHQSPPTSQRGHARYSSSLPPAPIHTPPLSHRGSVPQLPSSRVSPQVPLVGTSPAIRGVGHSPSLLSATSIPSSPALLSLNHAPLSHISPAFPAPSSAVTTAAVNAGMPDLTLSSQGGSSQTQAPLIVFSPMTQSQLLRRPARTAPRSSSFDDDLEEPAFAAAGAASTHSAGDEQAVALGVLLRTISEPFPHLPGQTRVADLLSEHDRLKQLRERLAI